MRNEQSVFDNDIDPLIFYSDVSLDNQHYLAQYYNLIKSGDYVGASDYIQSIDENVDFYGAWLLNLYENELYAIETNMYKYVTPQHKPKLTFHGSSEPTDPEFKTWVFCDINPGIPGPPAPSTPQWWFNSPGESPINDNGWEPCLGTYGWNGYYELTIIHEGSSNIGVNAPEIHSVQDIEAVRIPLVDSNGNETTYHLRFMFADELSPYFEDDIGLVLYNGDTVVKDWRLGEYGTLNQVSHYYLCIGVDTMDCIDYSQGQDPVSKHNILYACIIMEGEDFSQACVGYYGNAIDLTQLSSRGLYLSSDWYTPSNS